MEVVVEEEEVGLRHCENDHRKEAGVEVEGHHQPDDLQMEVGVEVEGHHQQDDLQMEVGVGVEAGQLCHYLGGHQMV